MGIVFVLHQLNEIGLGRERKLRKMKSLTKLIAHSSSATEWFSKEAVGVMLTWSAGKCTLVLAEETGGGLKIITAVKTTANLCCDTVRLTLPTLPVC